MEEHKKQTNAITRCAGDKDFQPHFDYLESILAQITEESEPIRIQSTQIHSHNRTRDMSKTSDASKAIPKAVRNAVWIEHCGRVFDAKCLCCGLENISVFNYHCGHVLSRKNGGLATTDNLRPICASCNTSMGSTQMDQFIAQYFKHETSQPPARSLPQIPSISDKPSISHAAVTPVMTSIIKAPADLSERMTTESTLQNKRFCIKIITGVYCCKPCESRNLLGYCAGCLTNRST